VISQNQLDWLLAGLDFQLMNEFNVLDFTHYIARKRSGEVIMKRKTKRKRRIAQIKQIKLELRKRLHEKPCETGRWLKSMVQGHINYYGVPFNSKSLCQFVYEVRCYG